MVTELIAVKIIKAVCGKLPGRIMHVPGGTAEMWIHQGKAERVEPIEHMVPPDVLSIKPIPEQRKRRNPTTT